VELDTATGWTAAAFTLADPTRVIVSSIRTSNQGATATCACCDPRLHRQ
jgi:hypothetical protein